jgi:CubicO group peptidase (beta-lactamase class C family)
MSTPANTISSFLDERIAAGDFPSAVYLVAEKGSAIFADARGNAVINEHPIPASAETIYDLASLTKPLVTGLLCSRRIEAGELTLDSSIAHYLAEFDRTDKQDITVRQLLTHTSGLPAWEPLYVLAEGERDRAVAALANLPLAYKPGARVLYSDLSFILLGFLLERMTGTRLAQLARQEIIQPLKLQHTFFNPEKAMQTGIAACETGNGYEREMWSKSGGSEYTGWRKDLIWGEVHDGNAHFLGGEAGHAGLFSTAQDTFELAQQFLAGESKLLKPETCELFRQNMTAELEETRSLGWQLAATKDSTAGTDLPGDSFGHTGFTGTSCWIDPQHERVFILLTNRTHARALPFANINGVRRRFHSLAVAALDKIGVA